MQPKFSIYSAAVLRGRIEDRIRAIKEAGFDAVCLDFGTSASATIPGTKTPLRPRRIFSRVMDTACLRCICTTTTAGRISPA